MTTEKTPVPAAIDQMAEAARIAYFGQSRRGPIRFDGVIEESREIWRDVARAVMAAAPASGALPAEAPAVPEDVLILIHKYGDARADDAGSAIAIGELVLGLRRWAAALASPQVAPAVPEALYGVSNDDINWPLVWALIDAHMSARQHHTPGTSNWGAWLYKALVRAARLAAPAPVAPTPAQPSEDAPDAARWRKLLAQDNEDFRFAVVKNPHFDVFETPEELEAAVDALPSEPEGENGHD